MNKGRGTPHKNTDDNSDSLIDEAAQALREGLNVTTREQAEQILPMWARYAELTGTQREAILDRFPETAATTDEQIAAETIDLLQRLERRVKDVEQRERKAYAHGYFDGLTGRTDDLDAVRHAWTVTRDVAGGRFLWACFCGHTVTQPFGEEAPALLLAHVTEAP